ncbi:response regulator transcription factor [Geomonas sp. Red32]|uniref:response regulator transcription factor n=1 Tax=Geomonas sp. Red32 TaxID=2912856 RepID=UPI00202CE7B2|nr:response regulator transcription factor [Geomonas sp. Red32]
MNSSTILIIDDDVELCALLEEYLGAEGLVVESVHDGRDGVQQALSQRYDMVILDVMLPGMNGLEVLRSIRSGSSVPVIMLTARGDDVDRIVGLELGADDYLPKPFNPRELIARLRAIQRRVPSSTQPDAPHPETLAVGDVTLDMGARTTRCGEHLVELTSVEFGVLETLLRQAGKVISRDDLSLQALGRTLNYQDRTIDVHISNIRRKLGNFADGSERIKAVRGVGYIYALAASGR